MWRIWGFHPPGLGDEMRLTGIQMDVEQGEKRSSCLELRSWNGLFMLVLRCTHEKQETP